MDFQKNYYATLGCTPNADHSVIQAAYRALAKKHHPDANQGSDESKAKFQEIQEAYEVLSDTTKRAYYDSMRAGKGGREYAPGEEHAEDSDTADTELQKRWEVVKEYYPDVDTLALELGKLSPNLELIFKTMILDTKSFKDAPQLSLAIEDIYLTRYFGEQREIKKFAKKLLKNKNMYQHADALRELNKTIAILGLEAPVKSIIDKLTQKYDLHWAQFGDVPYRTGEEHDAVKLPDSPAAWRAIMDLAPRYGWRYQQGFLGVTFISLNSSEKIRCFQPNEATAKMGIPLEFVIKKMNDGSYS